MCDLTVDVEAWKIFSWPDVVQQSNFCVPDFSVGLHALGLGEIFNVDYDPYTCISMQNWRGMGWGKTGESPKRKTETTFQCKVPPKGLGKLTSETTFDHLKVVFRPLVGTDSLVTRLSKKLVTGEVLLHIWPAPVNLGLVWHLKSNACSC